MFQYGDIFIMLANFTGCWVYIQPASKVQGGWELVPDNGKKSTAELEIRASWKAIQSLTPDATRMSGWEPKKVPLFLVIVFPSKFFLPIPNVKSFLVDIKDLNIFTRAFFSVCSEWRKFVHACPFMNPFTNLTPVIVKKLHPKNIKHITMPLRFF